MSIRVGLIGVEDNLAWIKSIVDEYPEFHCLPLLHYYDKDVIALLKAHSHEVDLWIFSGIYPYTVAKEWGQVEKPMFYIPYTGTSLYRTLYQILYQHHFEVDELSFDALAEARLKQIFDELSVPFHQNRLSSEYHSLEEVVDHHYHLWASGQTKAAVTCAWQVQTELERLSVPVFRVIHTKSAVQSVLNIALRTYEMLHFKDRQIAVQMFEFDYLSHLTKPTYASDEIYNIEINITQKLLNYAKMVQGSLKSVGPGRFVIFTTRGALSEITREFTVIPEVAETGLITQGMVTCGIGIGQSAYDAEIRAGTAMLHALEHGKGNWMAAFEDKTFHGPLGRPESISYSYNQKEIKQVSEVTSLSLVTISKIYAILKKMNNDEITAQELADQLRIMPRSARRILTQLEKKGFAKEVGEETPHLRGRPRKIYRIDFKISNGYQKNDI